MVGCFSEAEVKSKTGHNLLSSVYHSVIQYIDSLLGVNPQLIPLKRPGALA